MWRADVLTSVVIWGSGGDLFHNTTFKLQIGLHTALVPPFNTNGTPPVRSFVLVTWKMSHFVAINLWMKSVFFSRREKFWILIIRNNSHLTAVSTSEEEEGGLEGF